MASESKEIDVAGHLDGILLGRIQAGDQEALAALYDSRGPLIYSVVFSFVRNRRDAEELTQDVFLRVWEKSRLFDARRGSPLAWMVTIARRLAIDRVRSRGHRGDTGAVSFDKDRETELSRGAGESARPTVALEMAIERALDKLSRLSGEQREVIELAYYDGLSHAEIAAELSIPLGTVKSRLRGAIKRLRELVG